MTANAALMGTPTLQALLWLLLLHGLHCTNITDKSSVQVTFFNRDYMTGPNDGKFLLKSQDAMLAYAGPLPKATDPLKSAIRKWSVWADYTANTGGSVGNKFNFCGIHRVYNNGEYVMFGCPKGNGMHYLTVQDAEVKTEDLEKMAYEVIGTADSHFTVRDTVGSVQEFDLSALYATDGVGVENPYNWVALGDPPPIPPPVHLPIEFALSDPIDIVQSDYCYFWNYALEEQTRVGFIYRADTPGIRISKLGSYVLLHLKMWIIESNAIDQSETFQYRRGSVRVNKYSQQLTARFAAKGLLPCLREVHPAIEIKSEIKFVESKDATLRSPHWEVVLKIHTDTIISDISDVVFTISSRQHVALFKCFVGDTRVFVHTRDFNFINALQNDRNQVAWEYTAGPKILLQYMRLKVKQVWGHNTIYLGPEWGRIYQPGHIRRDLVVLSNACVVQEMAIAVAGRVYIAENFLREARKDLCEIILPGLDDDDFADDSGKNIGFERHRSYLPVTDIAFTPTHVAILINDGTIYLHSHSISIKGFAYIKETVKYKLKNFAKRRWCARTSTPKTSNMVIPGFGREGTIILLQVYPTEGIVSLWVPDPPKKCLAIGGEVFKQTKASIQAAANESCIHQDIKVYRSDERGLPVGFDTSQCGEKFNIDPDKKSVNPDELTHYLTNDGKLLGGSDPHFPKGLTVAVHKNSDNWTHYNLALIFQLDVSQTKDNEHVKVLNKQGLELLNTVEATKFIPEASARSYQLHSVEFTAVEKRFITGAQFVSKELENSEFKFTMMITTLEAVNMPLVLHPTGPGQPVTLVVNVAFPGVFLVRKSCFLLTGDKGEQDSHRVKIYPINTAIPTYVVDLGDVFVFSTIESQFARPLTYFRREQVMQIIKEQTKKANTKDGKQKVVKYLEESDRSPVFKDKDKGGSEPTEKVFDIAVTEQALVSILERRSRTNPNGSVPEVSQRVFIGSAVTLDSLREVKPFIEDDNVFQMSTNDGEIVYGKHTERPAAIYPSCTDEERKAIAAKKSSKSCIYQPNDKTKGLLCVLPDDGSVGIKRPCRGVEELKEVNGTTLRRCKGVASDAEGCLYLPEGEDEPKNLAFKELDSAKIMSIPFYSLLNANIEGVPERKVFEYSRKKIEESGETQDNRDNKKDRICPFSDFGVSYEKIAYVEIGFTTRLTGVVSYLGKNVPTEAELIVDYESLPGMQVKIHSGIGQEGDQTTLTKTIDISMSLVDLDLLRMKEKELLNTDSGSKKNVAIETTDIFTITIRPSIVNLRCNKEDLFVTVQYVVGCCPYNRMRLLSEASPLVRRQIKDHKEDKGTINVDGKNRDWVRQEDELIIPRDHVWHRQKDQFNCNKHHCKIPYANLFQDQVFDISWRDPFIPQFEQFLTSVSRLVTANVVLYDMLSYDTVFNVTQLEARCYHNGSLPNDVGDERAKTWYHRLLDSTKYIHKRAVEREDVYKFYSDCYDSTVMEREKPLKLSSQYYRLVNRTNFNRLRFDVLKPLRTKNRNQIFIFRAAVINTEYNRFTYCQLMDTFFLLRITGIPTPRQGLSGKDSAAIVLVLLLFFGIVYLVFYKFYTWKLDIPELAGTDVEEEYDENVTAWEGEVQSDHLMSRVTNRVNNMLKWRRKALENQSKLKGPSTTAPTNPKSKSLSGASVGKKPPLKKS